MYSVIKDIHDLNKIVISDIYNRVDDEVIPLEGSQIHIWGGEINIPISQYNLEWDHGYNNLFLTNPLLKTELIILQDYGDHGGNTPEGWLEIPRAIVLTDLNTSIGWYDGYLVLMAIYQDCLFVFKLAEYPKIDISRVREKRPYNFKILVENNYSSDSKIYWWICIQPGYTAGYKVTDEFLGCHFVKSEFTYGQVTHPDWLRSQLTYYPVNIEILSKWNNHYLRRDDFIINGFDFDQSQSCWVKGNLKVHDNLKEAPNYYFKIFVDGQSDRDAKYLFTQDDLKEAMSLI